MSLDYKHYDPNTTTFSLFEKLLYSVPELHIQLILCVFWMFICKLFIISPIAYMSGVLSHGKPWLKETIERDIAMYKKQIGVVFPFEKTYGIWKD